LAAAEQFVIDLADLVEHLQHLGISGHAVPGLVDLVGGLQQERLHLALGEAAVEIKERAVLGAAGVAAAVGFAALQESLDQGGVEEVGREFKGVQEMRLALAQGQGGGALERMYPTRNNE
jgi:hypothetical protein